VETRDKLITKEGKYIDSNIVGFVKGIYGKDIIIYTTLDNEKELLASYYILNGSNFKLEQIENDDEWINLEMELKNIEEQLKKHKINKPIQEK